MFRFWSDREHNVVGAAALSVVLIGEDYRRAYAKHLLEHPLADPVRVVGELASGKRVELLAEMGPETVVLDCASEGINPLTILSRLAALESSPRVVALVEGATELDRRALLDLGADAVADIQEPHALAEVVRLHDPHGDHHFPEETRPGKSLAHAA